jgi:pimeloyl-ACP methyl ester carboxylesterase
MRRLLKLLPILLLAPAAGLLYQYLGTQRDKRRFPQEKNLIDIGEGRQLYLSEQGEGTPTVIFESGIGATSQNWTWLQREVSRFTRTITYDRCGLGWSTPSPSPRIPSNIVRELHTLLKRAGIPPPYLLIGHSFGGLVVQRFAADHPSEVAGLILIDPMRPHEWPPFSDAQRVEIRRGLLLSAIGAPLARFGIARLAMTSLLGGSGVTSRIIARITGPGGRYLFTRIAGEVGKMPREAWPIVIAHWSSPLFYRGLGDHLRAVPDSTREMHPSASTHSIPILLLLASTSQPLTPEALNHLSPNARQLVVEQSEHWVHLDQPHRVLNAIQSMLEELRSTPANPTTEN